MFYKEKFWDHLLYFFKFTFTHNPNNIHFLTNQSISFWFKIDQLISDIFIRESLTSLFSIFAVLDWDFLDKKVSFVLRFFESTIIIDHAQNLKCYYPFLIKKHLQWHESVQQIHQHFFLHSSVIDIGTFLRWYSQLITFSEKTVWNPFGITRWYVIRYI